MSQNDFCMKVCVKIITLLCTLNSSWNRKGASLGMSKCYTWNQHWGKLTYIPADLWSDLSRALFSLLSCFKLWTSYCPLKLIPNDVRTMLQRKSHLWYEGYTAAYRACSPLKRVIVSDNPNQFNFLKLKLIVIWNNKKALQKWMFNRNSNLFLCKGYWKLWLNFAGIFCSERLLYFSILILTVPQLLLK